MGSHLQEISREYEWGRCCGYLCPSTPSTGGAGVMVKAGIGVQSLGATCRTALDKVTEQAC